MMAIDQIESEPTNPACEEGERSERRGLDRLGTGIGSRSTVGPSSVLLVTVGGLMLAYANGTIDALLVAFLLLIVGFAAITVVFPRGQAELRAFLLTYGMCAFMAGLEECYSRVVFGTAQSFPDAVRFLSYVLEEPPYWSKEELLTQLNAVYAIMAWQRVYALAMALGLQFGPYIGVLFNSFVVALSAAVTVRTARELFGDDAWRLRRVGVLFACCGMFWIFGAILIRDCFTLFLNALVFWTLVRWLVFPTLKNILLAAIVTGLSCHVMWYLRPNSVVLFGIFVSLTLSCWYCNARITIERFLITLALPVVMLFAFAHFQEFIQATARVASWEKEAYVSLSEEASSQNSLGLELVNRQPLPIRLVLGSGRMMVDPIPIWAYLKPNVEGYHVLKTYQAAYSIWIMPLVFLGGWLAVRAVLTRRKGLTPAFFVAAYSLMTLFAVVATSLETRHFGQFMPSILLLAAIPDTRQSLTRRRAWGTMLAWFVVVVMVHLAWATMKSL